MAKDFLQQDLKVGDKVVCIGHGFRTLSKAEVLKVCPKKVLLKTESGHEFYQWHEQVAKLKPQMIWSA